MHHLWNQTYNSIASAWDRQGPSGSCVAMTAAFLPIPELLQIVSLPFRAMHH
ncbi:hypothetical protein AURDEDRAFT_115919 [Auricularia subglabra TFB-10046 SS5]|nr:hypothetical protein AURDEDRAFT_115919 [Auricularia subglabra TFB-10046 SS5]